MYSYDRRQLVAVKAAPKGKVLALFEPFLKEHDEYIRKWVTDDANDLRDKALKLYPHPTSSKHGFGRTFRERVQWDAWVEKNGEAQLKETIEANRINQYREYRESVPPRTDQEAADWFYDTVYRDSPKSMTYGKNEYIPKAVNDAIISFGGWDSIHDDAVFKKAVDKEIEWSILNNRMKITHAINKTLGALPIMSVNEVISRSSRQGIEGLFNITLTDGTKGEFATRSIGAGGWNIQRFHFRYLMKVSPELKERNFQEKEQQGLPPEAVAVLQVLAPYKGEIVKGEPIPQKAKSAVYGLPGSSRNWGALIREGLVYKEEVGHFMVKRWNYFITDKGLKALDAANP